MPIARKSPTRVRKKSQAHGYLRISDVSRLVGISPTVLRLWENLGLVSPKRTQSKYRLYTQADIRILKRAQFLRRARKMNAPAIVHLMKTQGLLSNSSSAQKPSSVGGRLRRMRMNYGYSLAQVAGEAGVSVGFLSAIEREQMSASVSTLRRLARFVSAVSHIGRGFHGVRQRPYAGAQTRRCVGVEYCDPRA